jgi:CRP-like cAMP-binding protein
MQKIYEVMDFADSAFILHGGKLIFEVSDRDRYTIEGKEIIFGAEEPLIAHKTNLDEYFRFQTVLAEDETSFDRIPLKNLYKVISVYNIGYSVTKNIARAVQITNKMIIGKEKSMSGQDMASKDYARIYVEVVDRLRQMHQRLKIGWLGQLIARFTNSLVYMKGKAFSRASKSELKVDSEKLTEYNFDLRAGSILCEEGDKGHEMFILNRGNLEVLIAGKKVADITDVGTVIGEMALLLGEKRTATIKTVSESNITIVKPENLLKVAKNNQEFFLNIAVKLAKGLEHNCMLIREASDLMDDESGAQPKPPVERTNYKELLTMMRELERYDLKYKNEWLVRIINYGKGEINKVRDAYTTK